MVMKNVKVLKITFQFTAILDSPCHLNAHRHEKQASPNCKDTRYINMFDVLLIRKYSYIHLFHSTLHPDGHNAGFLQTSDMTGLPSYLTVSVQATRLHKTSALNYYHFYMLDNKIVEHFNIQQSLYKSLQKKILAIFQSNRASSCLCRRG